MSIKKLGKMQLKYYLDILIFSRKTSRLRWRRKFQEKTLFDTHSTKNATFDHFEEPIFFRFEKSYQLSRILRRICYNLVKKILRSVT